MSDKRFDVDATPDVTEIDRAPPAADRPNRIPSLNAVQWDNKKMVVGAALAGAVVFGVLSLVSGSGGDNKALEARKAPPPAAEAPYDPNSVIAPTLATAPRDRNAPVQLTGEQVPAIGPDGQPITPYRSAGGQQQSRDVSEAERRANEARELRDNARRSTLIAYIGDQAARRVLGDVAGAGNPQGDGENAPSRTSLDNLKQTSAIGTATARMIGDRNYLVTAGAIIPCTLQTAMDSSVPGYTTCIIPRDVYSDNGRVVLLEKGTRVFGEYQGGLQRGQNRLFTMWTRAVTPRGVAIDIGSPASDPLGRAGVTGKIDRFFWQRFGAAMLFSVLDAAGQIAGQAVSPQGSTVFRTPGDTTSQILNDTQQIRPIVRVNQGTEMAITVAKDFDFSQVYGLGLK
ncbi:type IV secretion system protein VirB10 [Sphingomonas carotinifaciens]|uniref:Type IV secretion system protein VirB10 n=1 Tax=Sphingomonas carotinifaciens TaxID=1166323 RepID=A0A1G7RDL3_9SPHN|nr:type IV secretion system protein VirB10 [Sphingomonas carotinifaciens]MBB4087992.1 type IV secretion system protein VirB10 [Sphingomonas carotinifaciens]SDG08886.1 type IV secretion system protein VirB10 [Sphingomonas carotinifaciens]